MFGAPLGLKPRIDVAWPGRPQVPGTLHADFLVKLGGDQDAADAELRAWYPVVSAHYEGKRIGEDDFTFWRARFREWVGTSTPMATVARTEGPAHAPDDGWVADCKARHGWECGTGVQHRERCVCELARAKRMP